MKLPQLQRDIEVGGGYSSKDDVTPIESYRPKEFKKNTDPPLFPIAAIMLLIGLVIGFLIGKLI